MSLTTGFLKWLNLTVSIVLIMTGAVTISQAQETPCDWELVASDVGQYVVFNVDADLPPVVLIQERHDLVDARLETAILIDRLLRLCDVRNVGLEGAFSTTDFDTKWFGNVPPGMFANNAVQMLGQGEINQGEFGALVYPNIYDGYSIHGIDDKTLYEKRYDSSGWNEQDTAMLFTGITQLNESQLGTVLEILNNQPDEDDSEEMWDAWFEELDEATYTNNPNGKIQEWYSRSNAQLTECEVISAEEEIEIYNLANEIILENSTATNALWDAEVEDMVTNSQSLEEFYQDAHGRSVTMVEQIEALNTHDQGMIAIIGAAHTRWIREKLVGDGYPVIVFSANHFCDSEQAVTLPYEIYERTSLGFSVDESGQLGDLIINDKNPPAVINRAWFQIKSSLLNIASVATYELIENPDATLKEIFDDVQMVPGIEIDENSLEASDDPGIYTLAVLYNVSDSLTNDIYEGTIYIGININQQIPETWNINNTSDLIEEIEPLLRAELAEVSNPNLVSVISNVSDLGDNLKAGFAKTKDGAIKGMQSSK